MRKNQSNESNIDNEVDDEKDNSRSPIIEDNISDNEADYVCDVCSRSFTSENSLRMHRLRSHRIQPKKIIEHPIPQAIRTEPFSDLFAELPSVKGAVEFSRWKQRLKNLDPEQFYQFFPNERPVKKEENDSVNLAFKIDREESVTDYFKAKAEALRNTSTCSVNPGFEEIKILREEIQRLKEEKETDFRNQILNKISDLETKLNDPRGTSREDTIARALTGFNANTSRLLDSVSPFLKKAVIDEIESRGLKIESGPVNAMEKTLLEGARGDLRNKTKYVIQN